MADVIGSVRSWKPTTVDDPWPDNNTGEAWLATARNDGWPSGVLGPGTRSCTSSAAFGDRTALAITTVRAAASGLGDNGIACVGKLSDGGAVVEPPSPPLLATAPPMIPAPQDAKHNGNAIQRTSSRSIRRAARTPRS